MVKSELQMSPLTGNNIQEAPLLTVGQSAVGHNYCKLPGAKVYNVLHLIALDRHIPVTVF